MRSKDYRNDAYDDWDLQEQNKQANNTGSCEPVVVVVVVPLLIFDAIVVNAPPSKSHHVSLLFVVQSSNLKSHS